MAIDCTSRDPSCLYEVASNFTVKLTRKVALMQSYSPSPPIRIFFCRGKLGISLIRIRNSLYQLIRNTEKNKEHVQNSKLTLRIKNILIGGNGLYSDEDRRKAFIDLCDNEYNPVREILIKQGKDAAEWTRSYIIKSDDVVVSIRKEFLKLLDKWGEDPCLKVK